MPRARPVEPSRLLLIQTKQPPSGCHGLVPWSFTLAANTNETTSIRMPRACPVEPSRLLLIQTKQPPSGCHGLVPWSFTLAANTNENLKKQQLHLDATGLSRGAFTLAAITNETTSIWMPRACPVELHACCYYKRNNLHLDATGLSRGASRLLLIQTKQPPSGCHGLVPWSFTLAAITSE